MRNAATFPFSSFMSIFVTSATRRSRSEPAAVSTALRPASSHDLSLTPTTSTILWTRIGLLFRIVLGTDLPPLLLRHGILLGLVCDTLDLALRC